MAINEDALEACGSWDKLKQSIAQDLRDLIDTKQPARFILSDIDVVDAMRTENNDIVRIACVQMKLDGRRYGLGFEDPITAENGILLRQTILRAVGETIAYAAGLELDHSRL